MSEIDHMPQGPPTCGEKKKRWAFLFSTKNETGIKNEKGEKIACFWQKNYWKYTNMSEIDHMLKGPKGEKEEALGPFCNES